MAKIKIAESGHIYLDDYEISGFVVDYELVGELLAVRLTGEIEMPTEKPVPKKATAKKAVKHER